MPTWLAPQDLSASGQNALAPQVALDAVGNAVVVWRRGGVVQASDRPAGGDWSAPQDLSASGEIALQPQLAVNAAGDAVAIWVSGTGLDGIIEASVRPAGGDWSEPQELSAPGPDGEHPRVAIDAAGDAVAVWLHSDHQPGDASTFIVQAATRPAGGAWSAPQDLVDQGHNQGGPNLAINAAGDAVAVWRAHVGSANVFQAATRPAGGGWSAPEDIAGAGPGEGTPQVALGPAGEAVVVWAGLFTGRVHAVDRPVGGDWSEPQDLSVPGGNAEVPRLAVGAAGDAVAVWRGQDGSDQVVQVSERAAGVGDWSPAQDLSAPGQDIRGLYVAVDGAGAAVAVWNRGDGSNQIAQARARAAGGAWSATQDLSAPGQDALETRVAVDAAGDAVAVWRRSDGSNGIVQAAVYDVVAPELHDLSIPAMGTAGEPVSFSVSPFDAFTAVAATSWSFGDGGEASGNAVSHVYAAAGTYPVTVTAVDSGGNASAHAGTIAVAPPPPLDGRLPPPLPPRPVPRTLPDVSLAFRVEMKSLRRLLRTRRLVVAARVNRAANVRLTGRARLKVRGKPRTRLVAVFRRKAVRFADAGRKRVRLVLTKRGRRALRGLRRVRLVIVGRATDTDGETATRRVALTLRARPTRGSLRGM